MLSGFAAYCDPSFWRDLAGEKYRVSPEIRMPKRTAKFVSAAFVNVLILGGIPLAVMARGETATADACLSAPKGETPAGGHWYYRVDHANKRNCWYLRSDGGGQSQAAQSAAPAPSAPPAARPAADARAELRTRSSQEDSPAVSPPAAVPPVNAPGSTAWPAPPAATEPAAAAATAVAPRWPDPAATTPVSAGGSGTANLADSSSPASADLPDAAAASATADSATQVQPDIIQTLIAAAIGALVFAGAAAAFISRRNRARRPRHRKMAHSRGLILETTDDDRIILEDHPAWENRNYQPRFARGAGGHKVQAAKMRTANVQHDRRAEFTSRMPRQAPR
jgi:hypothetical protein